MTKGKIKIGIIGVGNCFAGLLHGITYYHRNPERKRVGIMHERMGGYTIEDFEFVCAFDIAKNKVGRRLDEAVMAEPNMVDWITLPKMDVIVSESPVLDGVGRYVKDLVKPVKGKKKAVLVKEIKNTIEDSGTEVLVNYLPVGSQKATEFWAEMALKTGCGFVNCIPVFIASDRRWEKRFRQYGVPVIGDDIKGMVGSTIVHRVLTRLVDERGAELTKTYQLNVGGNTDFKNMLERERLKSKKISKTESVQSQLRVRLAPDRVHIGPSDFVPFLRNNKLAFIRLEGNLWADRPFSIELKLDVDDKANSAGIVADAVRAAKIALERGSGGAIESACAYLMKHPPRQMSDDEARRELEHFIAERSEEFRKKFGE